jgi:hypothetical protein
MADDNRGTSASWWGGIVSQFLLPASISTLVAAGVSIYAEYSTAQANAQTYNASFEKLLSDSVIANKGFYTGDTRQAAATLMALEDLAETERQKETVLLIGARLVHANPDPSAAAAPARVLAVMIDEAEHDATLRAFVHTRSYFDLVTSGYENEYFVDSEQPRKQMMVTLNGDQPVGTGPEETLLEKLGTPPTRADGWIHLATFSTTYRHEITPAAASARASTAKGGASAVVPKTAIAFVSEMAEVSHGNFNHACNVREQFAIATDAPAQAQPSAVGSPAPSPPSDPQCAPAALGAMPPLIAPTTWTSRRPEGLLILAPRLLRDRPPVDFVSPDGTFMQGSLGRIIGVVPAGTCIDAVDDVRPILVFVESQYSRGKLPPHTKPEPNHWAGLIHLWAHVEPSKRNCTFPTPAAANG